MASPRLCVALGALCCWLVVAVVALVAAVAVLALLVAMAAGWLLLVAAGWLALLLLVRERVRNYRVV